MATAPGRINLIGEHTDYNDGFVFPLAIDRYVGVAFAASSNYRLRVYAPEYDELRTVTYADLHPGQDNGWIDYVAGMAWVLQEETHSLPGADIVIDGNIPIGAGLSSSAALEVACGRAFAALGDIPWDPAEIARLGRRAENEYVGVSCGIMDQYAAALSRSGQVMLLDCRSLETTFVPLPAEVRVIVMDTGVRRSLADSVYNERTRQCRQAVEKLRVVDSSVRALRDVSPDMLHKYRNRLDPLIFRRARHVVEENHRTKKAAERLPDAPEEVGRLMKASHESLRDLYEVSSDELDAVVEAANKHPACYGARLTGAGMGGCGVALIQSGAENAFIETVGNEYNEQFDHESDLFPTEPSAGVRMIES
jgi:galactokinase